MTSYANRITDLEKQIAILKQQELQEIKALGNKKNNSIEYNLQRIQQILDWNDMRTDSKWKEMTIHEIKNNYRYPGDVISDHHVEGFIKGQPNDFRDLVRAMMLFGRCATPEAGCSGNRMIYTHDDKYKEYSKQNSLPVQKGDNGYGLLNMLQSINTSLNILNQRVSKIEKLIHDKKFD